MFKRIKINAALALGVIQNFVGTQDEATKIRMVSANHIARTVAYQLDKVKISEYYHIEDPVDVLDADGNIREYLPRYIFVPVKGLVCYLLIAKDSENNRLHVAFRGTKDLPACIRDLELGAPGHQSFHEHRDILLEELNGAIQDHYNNQKVSLFISGHSLGGADAQNFFASVIQTMAQKYTGKSCFYQSNNILQIHEVSLNAANTAGIKSCKAVEAKMDASYLAKEHDIKLKLIYIITAGDVVPQSGQSHILSDCDPAVAEVNLVKISTHMSGWLSGPQMAAVAVISLPFSGVFATLMGAAAVYTTFNAHKVKFSAEQQAQESDYEIFSNTDPDSKLVLTAKLSKHGLNNKVVESHSSLASSALLFSTNVERTPSPPHNEGWVFVDSQEVFGQQNLIDGYIAITAGKLKYE